MLGKDRHGFGYSKIGRGNISPCTIILPKIGIKHGIVSNEHADIEGFWAELDEVLDLSEKTLIERFWHIAGQSPKSFKFMYDNGTMRGFNKDDKTVYNAVKHGTNAIGYIGIAETCQAMFGKDHADPEVREFALEIVKRIYDRTKEASERHDLNFSCYATPSESLCKTAMNKLKEEFGEIPNVTERKYLTNSHHVPVWQKISAIEKINIESEFTSFCTAGTITYVELDSGIKNNPEAVEQLINYAMEKDIPYFAINHPIDTCLNCGYSDEFNDTCPKCGSTEIEQLRRVTGYLTTDYHNFNEGKIAEVEDRVVHNKN